MQGAPGKVLDLHHQVVVLGDLPGDLHNGSLLKGVCTNHFAGHLTRDGNHGNRVQQSIGKTCDQVRGSGTRGGYAHTHIPCSFRIALCCKDLTLRQPKQLA